jgi:site-specific recombinase XerD
LRDAKGLATNTRAQRLRIVQQFLECDARCKSGRVKPLTAKALRYFNSQQLKRWSSASAHVLAGALRSYVRFRAVCGDQVEQLLPTIASPAHWRLASLPETLSPAEIEALLSSFKPGMPSRLRAFAMMRCVVDLGLRACEVVLIELNDIDWRAGTIRVGQSKSRRVDVLPLPHATGSALAKYLRFERPSCASRRLFVRHVAPVERLIGPGVVRRAVREAYSRCNLPHTRVHILRHTLASRLLAGGATLKEVADVLRHRDLDTSLIYAKVDRAHLAAVAQPWPGRRP